MISCAELETTGLFNLREMDCERLWLGGLLSSLRRAECHAQSGGLGEAATLSALRSSRETSGHGDRREEPCGVDSCRLQAVAVWAEIGREMNEIEATLSSRYRRPETYRLPMNSGEKPRFWSLSYKMLNVTLYK